MDIEKWWLALPESVRAEIEADASAPLSAEAVIALTRVRGVGPAAAAFEGRRMDFHLTGDEIAWVTANSGR